MKEIKLSEYKTMFSKMLCSDCNVQLVPSKKHEGSGGSRYPTCPKCKKEYGYLAFSRAQP